MSDGVYAALIVIAVICAICAVLVADRAHQRFQAKQRWLASVANLSPNTQQNDKNPETEDMSNIDDQPTESAHAEIEAEPKASVVVESVEEEKQDQKEREAQHTPIVERDTSVKDQLSNVDATELFNCNTSMLVTELQSEVTEDQIAPLESVKVAIEAKGAAPAFSASMRESTLL